MSAKTCMLGLADSDARAALARLPALDRDAAEAQVERLFPGKTLEPLGEGDLSNTDPPDNEILIGCFRGVTVMAAREFGIDHPSKLDRRFLDAGRGRVVTLHAMHSVVDWFVYAIWEQGTLVRSLSRSPNRRSRV